MKAILPHDGNQKIMKVFWKFYVIKWLHQIQSSGSGYIFEGGCRLLRSTMRSRHRGLFFQYLRQDSIYDPCDESGFTILKWKLATHKTAAHFSSDWILIKNPNYAVMSWCLKKKKTALISPLLSMLRVAARGRKVDVHDLGMADIILWSIVMHSASALAHSPFICGISSLHEHLSAFIMNLMSSSFP